MYLRKTGFPDDNELVFGEVTNIQHNSVFVDIEEYGRTGLIHISEISSGRIKDIKNYVTEGDRIIAKVIQIDREKGHVDLSLRRVTELQKKNKRDQRKQEQKAESLIDDLADELGQYPQKIYQDIKLATDIEYLHEAFNHVVEDNVSLAEQGFPDAYADPLERIVRDKITRETVRVGGEIDIETYASDGLHVIKDALNDAESKHDSVEINYLGAGKYKISVEDYNYNDAENTLEEALTAIQEPIEASDGGSYAFEKTELDA